MSHYRTLLDPSRFIGPQDFEQPKKVTISRAVREAMNPDDGDSELAPMLYFSHEGKELPRVYKVPKSVLYGLSCLLGTDTQDWVGKQITLFKAKCLSFGEVEECVRVEFPADVEAKVMRWLKKRKLSPKVYRID